VTEHTNLSAQAALIVVRQIEFFFFFVFISQDHVFRFFKFTAPQNFKFSEI